jgi:hypothetical protein
MLGLAWTCAVAIDGDGKAVDAETGHERTS